MPPIALDMICGLVYYRGEDGHASKPNSMVATISVPLPGVVIVLMFADDIVPTGDSARFGAHTVVIVCTLPAANHQALDVARSAWR